MIKPILFNTRQQAVTNSSQDHHKTNLVRNPQQEVLKSGKKKYEVQGGLEAGVDKCINS